jgi:hypothetical protein
MRGRSAHLRVLSPVGASVDPSQQLLSRWFQKEKPAA